MIYWRVLITFLCDYKSIKLLKNSYIFACSVRNIKKCLNYRLANYGINLCARNAPKPVRMEKRFLANYTCPKIFTFIRFYNLFILAGMVGIRANTGTFPIFEQDFLNISRVYQILIRLDEVPVFLLKKCQFNQITTKLCNKLFIWIQNFSWSFKSSKVGLVFKKENSLKPSMLKVLEISIFSRLVNFLKQKTFPKNFFLKLSMDYTHNLKSS